MFEYYYFGTSPEGRFLYGLVSKDGTARYSNTTEYDIEYEPSDGKFYDVGTGSPITWSQDNTGMNTSAFPTQGNIPILYWYDTNGNFNFQFDNPYYVAPPEPAVEPVERLVLTFNHYPDSDYAYMETTPAGRFLYALVDEDTTDRREGDDRWDFEYDPSDNRFYDVGASFPRNWATDANGTNLSDFPTAANMQTLYFYDSGADNLRFQCNNPYYVAPPPEPVVEPVEIMVATDGSWYNEFDLLYFETTSSDRFLYGMVSQGSTSRYNGSENFDVEYDPSDKKLFDVGSSVPHSWGLDNTGTNTSAFPTAVNMQTLYWFDSGDTMRWKFENPYYVA